jgi:hypothetical protein
MWRWTGISGALLATLVVLTGLVTDAPVARAQGAASFVARVDRTSTDLGDPIVYEVTLSMPDGRAEGYRAPDFRGFRVLGEYPSQSTQIQMGGGSSVMRTVYTWRYELSPSESGRLTIMPARVRVRGKELRTAPVAITVAAGDIRPPGSAGSATDPRRTRQRPRPRARLGSPFDDLFGGPADPDPLPPIQVPDPGGRAQAGSSFIRAVADKRKVVVGEQVVVQWYLYLTERQDKYQAVTEPRTDGFWSEDLPVPSNQGNLQLSQQEHEGRLYLVAPLMRKALFPLQSGSLTVTPLEADISQADFFGRLVRNQRLKAEPLAIEVEPLPGAGKPASFDPAAVGKLAMSAKLDRQQVAVGDAVTVTVTVSGQGNLRKLVPPKLPALEGFRSYEPKVDVKLDTSNGVTGSKVIEYLLLPERAGTTIVPSIELAYFDPAARRYERARTDPLRIVVTGEGGKGAEPGRTAAVAVGRENVLASEIRPPRAGAELSRDLGTTLYRSSGFFWAVLLPPVAFALTAMGGRFRRRLGQDTEGSRRRQARRQVRQHLRAAEGQLGGDSAAFYMEIDRVLSGALSGRLGQPVAGLSRVELAAELGRSGLPRPVVDQALAALEECDRARFAPGSASAGERRVALERAAELLSSIEKPAIGKGVD